MNFYKFLQISIVSCSFYKFLLILVISTSFYLVSISFSLEAHAATINKPPLYLSSNNGLVGYWTMDGKNINWKTGAVTDSSGKGNTGFVTNMATSTSAAIGRIGQALEFDGVDDFVNAGSEASLNLTEPLSIAAWIYPRSFGTSDGVGVAGIIVDKGNNFDTGYQFRVRESSSGLRYCITNCGSIADSNNDVIILNSWQHVAVVANGTTAFFYVNGTSAGSANISSPPSSAGDSLRLGLRNGDNLAIFNGLLDDVRVYNRALSANEVTALFNSGAAKFNVSSTKYLTDGLVGYWTMDGKNINWKTGAVTDSSGKGNTGFVTNMATSTAQAIGRIGQALSFDGNNQAVSMGVNSNLNISTQTNAAWIKLATSSPDTTIKTIYSYANFGGGGSFFITVGDELRWTWGGGCCFHDTLDVNFQAGVWYHVAVTYTDTTSTANVKIYVDGVLRKTGDEITNPISTSDATPAIGGREFSGTFIESLGGFIDDVRVYNRALSANEVTALFNSGAAKFNVSPTKYSTDGLVGYWTMDGKNVNWKTGAVTDSSGKGNTGFVTNMATSTSPAIGKIGQALNFDGSNDFVNVPDAANLRPNNGSWSVSVWAKPPNANQGGTQGGALVTKRQTVDPFEHWGLSVCGNSDCSAAGQQLVAFFRTDGTLERRAISNADVADGNWHHYIMVADKSADKVKLYLDGSELVATLTTVGAWPTVDNTDPLRIGDNGDLAKFNGLIDDVRIYNRALSADEVLQLYNIGR